ncbi:coiled-coil domain-containing protein 80 isoform X2 [Sphaeramia orbicularis]|uniref:Coiled-coil domain-containing protein 80-like n=1 Tax=Sphaeramia orbicularis TaxID=375764 RepID=A0A673BEV5_9TELE|nr:coiled-coil domain-containing protein 80-like isoform X2 [Sphaeramia orbicularis]
MFQVCKSYYFVLFLAAVWSVVTARPGISQTKPEYLDPNIRDWGDYSDLVPGVEQGLGLDGDAEHGDTRGGGEVTTSLASELDFLAEFAGKKRLWVITAPSHNDNYLRMMEKQLEDMEQDGLNCRLAERDTFIITIIQNAMMEGRIQKTTFQGEATVESLDPDTVTKLLHYLDLTSQDQGFTMLVLKKNLRVSERFPYPVRLEAILELIDQFPMRKLEKITRKGSNFRVDSVMEEDQKRSGEKKNEVKSEPTAKDDKKEKKKKGKGKGKKGKGRGKKSNRDASEKDKAALKEFLESLKGSRRLMLISTPSQDGKLYIQQKEENEKLHCDLAIRKITLATIVGEGSDATLTVQHHQLGSEPPLSNPPEQFSDPGLISLLRSELGLSSPDLFSMTVTDYDITPDRVFEAPPSSPALFEYIDNFPSRRPEKEKERKSPPDCSKDAQQPGTENSLLRFMSKRRLLLISAPSEDDYSFQQQLSALSGQDCQLGIRHFAMLKLTGVGDTASGTVQLFPLNGRSQSEIEPLPRDTVNNLRDQLKISKDYFSMLVVGKDSDVKAWFPSPMWSLDNIYDLVDSMELRLQEENLQRRLGIHCPDDRGRGGSEGGHYHGFDGEGAEEGYFYHQPEE